MRSVTLSLTLATLLLILGCAAPASAPTAAPTQAPAATSQPASGPKISIQGAWVRPAVAGQNSAAYLVVANQGTAPDALVAAKLDASIAKMTEVHETKMEGGVMKMSPVSKVEVPAGGKVEFKPGGYHIMLMELQRDLKEGETITITLTFEKSGNVTVQASVKSQS